MQWRTSVSIHCHTPYSISLEKNISSTIDPNATASIKDLNDTNGSVEDTLTESSYKPKYKGYSTYDYLLNNLGEEKKSKYVITVY